MKRAALVLAICGVLAAVILLGLRDIRRSNASLLGSAAPSASDNSADNETLIKFVKDPQAAPPLTVKDIDGNTLSLAAMKGHVVLVNFWATWCQPCKEEIPDLIKLQTRYQGKLEIIGLASNDTPVSEVKSFVQQNGMNYHIAITSPEIEAKFGGVMGLPTSFVIDPQGRVVQKHIGLRNPALYDSEVRALLGMPVNGKVETFDDTGQVMLANASKATELPGVDLSTLTPDQRKVALRQFNEIKCTCGCDLTLAQCRINDSSCDISLKATNQRAQKIALGTP